MTDASPPWYRRLVRWLFALALFPPCVGISWAVVDLVSASGAALHFWVPFLAGGVCWMVVYLSLPKPMWVYVVGHELTHALWALLFGARVRKIKVSSKGGHVVVTKSNSLIVLAPYFFPLYAVLWTLLFSVLGIWLDTRPAMPGFHLGLGIAYAFHLSLTVQVLRTDQPDLRGEGWFFSLMLIWFAHSLLLLLAIPMLTDRVRLGTAFGWALDRTVRVVARVLHGW